jgi:TolA-binding protein
MTVLRLPVLMVALVVLLLPVPMLAAEEPAFGVGERVLIEPSMLERWDRVSRMAVGPRAAAFIAEGEQVLARYTELLALEESIAGGEERTQLNIEVSKLKLTLVSLLRSIEEASLFDMGPGQLNDLREQYLQERERLLAERSQVRSEVLAKGEEFLDAYRRDRSLQRFSQRDVVAKLCLQLAELYYNKTDEEYFAAQDSLLERMDRGLPPGVEPVRDYVDAVRKYQRVIDEFPFSEYMDDALYNVAYIRENSRDPLEVEASRRLYEQLVRDFPSSEYAPESWMRLGEHWFRRDGTEALAEAVRCYEQVLEYPDFSSREKALYKLGWCHYRLGDNARSVEMFGEAAKYAVRRMNAGESVGADLLDESIAYIAVNYADPDWPMATVEALSAALRADREVYAGFGFRLMDRYGDLFREEMQDFDRAVVAYDSLMALYPDHPQRPFIQEKVIACYGPGALGDEQSAYREKDELFALYNQGGWSDEAEHKEQLGGLMNRRLQENVAQSMALLNSGGRREQVDEFVLQSRRYLEAFPEDSTAYSIHWNMAKTIESRLEDYPTAYEEYLRISRDYPGREVRDAAYNAIVIGQLLVDAEGLEAPLPDDSAQPLDGEALQASPLTPMEEKKLAALDNFVELFPGDVDAPAYALTAGKMYYAHHDFASATGRFDELISTWPDVEQAGEAYQLKLEALFALGRFQEAEAIAREIQDLGLSGDVAARARTRQAESVYAFAAELQQAANHLEAAREFKRMALDVPDAAFADAALFDAANEFSLAGEPREAAETYIYLADTYPASAFADRAVSLAATLYLNELKELAVAASTFERLAQNWPDSEFSRSAIGNAAYCYEKVSDWVATIRMNQLYVERYPQAEDAALILFQNAGLYLKLDDVASANRIYGDFAARYPDDSRTVQAFVERADWFIGQGDELSARAEYGRAVERNRQLLARGGEGNALHAARALRRLVDWRFEEYRGLPLRQPARQLEQDVAAKRAARDALLSDLGELVRLGTGEVFYARYMIAACHEEFAGAWRRQERPGYRDAVEEVRAEVEIQDAVRALSEVAVESYITTTLELEGAVASLKRQQRMLGEQRASLEAWLASPAAEETPAAREDSLSRRLVLQKASDVIDSSLSESTIWTGRSREKVPEVVMASLEEFEKRLDQALALRSEYSGDVFLRLADTDSNLLGGAAVAAARAVIEAYRQGLETIARVGLERLWRPRLEQRIRGRIWRLPEAYAAFRGEAYGEFDRTVSTFLATVDQGEDYVDARGYAQEDYGSEVLDMVDFNQGYALNSLLVYDSLLEILSENQLAGGLSGDLSDSLAAQALEFSRANDRRIQQVDSLKEEYWSRFEQSASYVHRDAHSVLDDASYFLRQTSREVLVQAELVVSRVQPGSVPARRLLFTLAQIDPATFGDKFGLDEQVQVLGSSERWVVLDRYVSGFERLERPAGEWRGVVPARVGLPALPDAAAIWKAGSPPAEGRADTLWLPATELGAWQVEQVLDTLQAEVEGDPLMLRVLASAAATAAPDTVYLRGEFLLEGTPVAARLQVAADDAYFLFFNGEYIDEQEASSGPDTGVHDYALDEFLRPGENVIAVEVQDRDGSGGALAARLEVREVARLTEELFEQQLLRELQKQQQVDFERRVNRIYDKNRID